MLHDPPFFCLNFMFLIFIHIFCVQRRGLFHLVVFLDCYFCFAHLISVDDDAGFIVHENSQFRP